MKTFALQVVGMVTFFAASLLGYFFPLLLGCGWCTAAGAGVDRGSLTALPSFVLAKAFSAGAILGVALLHLLAEANATLAELLDYPLGLALLATGFVITLGLDQVTLHVLHGWHGQVDDAKTKDRGDAADGTGGEAAGVASSDASIVPRPPGSPACSLPEVLGQGSSADAHHLRHDIDRARSLSKAVVLEVSVAIHSLIIGFGFGALEDQGTIEILMIVLNLHQLFEGVGMGAAIADSPLGFHTFSGLGFLFAVMVPAGVALGFLLKDTGVAGEWVSGCANCVAAGSLTYTATVEMVAADFGAARAFERPWLKASMFFMLALGVAIMAVLAIWA